MLKSNRATRARDLDSARACLSESDALAPEVAHAADESDRVHAVVVRAAFRVGRFELGRPSQTPHAEAVVRLAAGVTIYWRDGCPF